MVRRTKMLIKWTGKFSYYNNYCYYYNYYYYYYSAVLVDSQCSIGRTVAAPDRPVPYQTPDDALVLLSCPFCAKDPCLVLHIQQLKVYRTRFSYSSISPLSIKANL